MYNKDAEQPPRVIPLTAFTVPELSVSCGLSERKLRREISAGRLDCIRIGRRLLVTREQLEQYFQRCTTTTIPAERMAASILSRPRRNAGRKRILSIPDS